MSWIRESNLIENIDNPVEDARCERAWRWFRNQKLTKASILKLHGKVTLKQLPPKWRAKLRPVDVTVGGRLCPAYYTVPALFDGWLQKWATEPFFVRHLDDAIEDLIKQAHVEFEHIHPFVDGNGRVGRMVMNWHRFNAGLPYLTIEAAERWDYYAWFR